MEQGFAHILIEMSYEMDCRFLGSWLMKLAEVQTLWREALSDPAFWRATDLLRESIEPDLEGIGMYIFAKLHAQQRAIALDVDGPEGIEVAILVHMGLLVRDGHRYRLAIPTALWLEKVKQACFRTIGTAAEVGFGPVLHPEALLHTYPKSEAEAWLSWIIEKRRMSWRHYEPDVQVIGPVRIMMSNALFRTSSDGTLPQ